MKIVITIEIPDLAAPSVISHEVRADRDCTELTPRQPTKNIPAPAGPTPRSDIPPGEAAGTSSTGLAPSLPPPLGSGAASALTCESPDAERGSDAVEATGLARQVEGAGIAHPIAGSAGEPPAASGDRTVGAAGGGLTYAADPLSGGAMACTPGVAGSNPGSRSVQEHFNDVANGCDAEEGQWCCCGDGPSQTQPLRECPDCKHLTCWNCWIECEEDGPDSGRCHRCAEKATEARPEPIQTHSFKKGDRVRYVAHPDRRGVLEADPDEHGYVRLYVPALKACHVTGIGQIEPDPDALADECQKVPHVGVGFLHDEDYDGPYEVDGVLYCGRCHSCACKSVTAKAEAKKTRNRRPTPHCPTCDAVARWEGRGAATALCPKGHGAFRPTQPAAEGR